MAARKSKPAAEPHRNCGDSGGIVITTRRLITWGAAVASLGAIGSACYATVNYVDSRYLLRVVGEKYQVSNCVRFETGRQQTVEDAIAKLEIQRDESQKDKRVTFNAADRATLNRWMGERRTEEQIRSKCIEETKQP